MDNLLGSVTLSLKEKWLPSMAGETKRICDVRMNDHQTDKNSHVYEHHSKPGHEIDF